MATFPLQECAAIMVRETRAYEPKNLDRIGFAIFGDQAEEAFRRALGELES